MNRALVMVAAALLVAAPLSAQGGGRATPPPPAGAAQGRGAAKPDTQTAGNSVVERGARSQMTVMREVFSYSSGGRRDPMVSLMASGDIRPLITELQVMAIVYDEQSSDGSIATLLNTTDKKTLYRVKVGQTLGRLKVAQITRREVVFTVDEFGFSRQERLSIKPDTSKKGTP